MPGAGSLTLFHFRGIRVSVDYSWFLVLFFSIFWLSNFYGDVLGQDSGSLGPYALAVASAIGFFGSILLHELGHAVVAIRNGIGISGIHLWIFGGLARMDSDADSPGTEFKIAAGGPLVTFAIVVLLTAVGVLAAGTSDFRDAAELRVSAGTSGVLTAVAWLAMANLLVLVFNLLPAFPMDGGRIVRAIAWWKTGNRSSATLFAARLGQGFAYLFIGLGLVLLFTRGDAFTGIWLVLIGMVINGSARAAAFQTTITNRIEGVSVADVMDSHPVAIPADLSLDRAMEEYFLRYRWPWFPVVDSAEHFRGLIEQDRADEVPEGSRATFSVGDLVDLDGGQLFVNQDAPLDTVLGNSNLRRFGALMAVDDDGRLRGVVTAEQVERALRGA
jgi:Zn-dependent protease